MSDDEMQNEEVTAEKQSIPIEDLTESEKIAFDVIADVCVESMLNLKPVVRSIQSPYMEIELVGEDALISFGKNGKQLDALQYLCNLIISRKVPEDVRVSLDASDYRARRVAALETLARECAQQVIERQEEAELDPLPSHERRILHNILSTIEGIRTYSEGEDPNRHVIIAPA